MLRVFMFSVLMTSLSACARMEPMQHPSETPSVRVMSFNIRLGIASDGANAWPHRREMLMKVIRDFDPDLLGAQEVLAFQADELREQFPAYTFIGVGRDDGARGGEFSPILYRTDRFDLVDHGFFWLSESPEKPGSKSWDSSLPRMASWAKLRDRRDSGREFLFINTHWDHAGAQARLESARLMRHRVHEIAPGMPVIMTGDLNCTEDTEPYLTLVAALDERDEDTRWIDSYREVHPQRLTDEATFHGFEGTIAGSRIDFILYTPDFAATEATIDRTHDGGRYPSDHYAVTAVLRRRKR